MTARNSKITHYVNLFSPSTHRAFSEGDRSITGFPLTRLSSAKKVRPGDLMVCYLTVVSRWCGILQVLDGPFQDDSPIFESTEDPFVIRFHVKPVVWLDVEHAIPIHDESIWTGLSFTRDLGKGSGAWTGMVRSSLTKLDERDGSFLLETLLKQETQQRPHPIDGGVRRKLETLIVNRADKAVAVSVPERHDEAPAEPSSGSAVPQEARESHQIQALLAEIGVQMGLKVWIPPTDRGPVLRERPQIQASLLERLPLNYDTTTLRTIEQIDVIWIRSRYIVRAFEVEHTTSVYSGILRMADLLALQPNVDIKLHIVAPRERREKVLQEIRRPVFSLLEKGPLAESCTYISYEGIRQLAAEKHLAHFSDTVLDEYTESDEA